MGQNMTHSMFTIMAPSAVELSDREGDDTTQFDCGNSCQSLLQPNSTQPITTHDELRRRPFCGTNYPSQKFELFREWLSNTLSEGYLSSGFSRRKFFYITLPLVFFFNLTADFCESDESAKVGSMLIRTIDAIALIVTVASTRLCSIEQVRIDAVIACLLDLLYFTLEIQIFRGRLPLGSTGEQASFVNYCALFFYIILCLAAGIHSGFICVSFLLPSIFQSSSAQRTLLL